MMNRVVRAVFAAAVVVGFGSAWADTLPTSAYVRRNLAVMYDAQENPAAAAGLVNLGSAGSSYDLTAVGSGDKIDGGWICCDTGWVMSGALPEESRISGPGYTGEYVGQQTGGSGGGGYCTVISTMAIEGASSSGAQDIAIMLGSVSADAPGMYATGLSSGWSYYRLTTTEGDVGSALATRSGAVDAEHTTGCFENGKLVVREKVTSSMAAVNKGIARVTLGNLRKGVEYYWKGQLGCVRIYTDVLSDREIAFNAAVDAVRYRSVPAASAPWPEDIGYRNGRLEASLTIMYNESRGTASVGGVKIPSGVPTAVPMVGGEATFTVTPVEGTSLECVKGVPATVNPTDGTVTVRAIEGCRFALVFEGDGAIPASAYVQGGLVLQYDGIANAGVGAPHDGAARVWKDLSPSGNDADLTAMGAFGENGLEMSIVKGAQYAAATKGKVKPAGAIEMFFTPTGGDTSTIGVMWAGHPTYGTTPVSLGRIVHTGKPKYFSFTADANGKWLSPVEYGTSYHVAYVNQGGSTMRAYADCVDTEKTSSTALKESQIAFGGFSGYERRMTGTIYSVRVYDRALTADELRLNANLDRIRFEDADPADLTWPTGSRFNEMQQRVEVFAEFAGLDGATIALDGETFETATNGWFALGQSVTVTAKPASGQLIAFWRGLPGAAQVSDDKTTATFDLAGFTSVAAVSHAPVTLRWRGGSSAFASDAANWAKDGGGATSLPPQNGDAVCFDKDSPSMTWDLDDVLLSGWTQDADYKGTNTFLTGQAGTGHGTVRGVLQDDGTRALVVTGDVKLEGGMWTHELQPSTLKNGQEPATSGRGVYRLIAKVGGKFSLAADAAIDVTKKGLNGMGPHSAYCGHGGQGGSYWGTTAANLPYGSIKRPRTVGTGSSGYGGGSVELHVSGAAVIDGPVTTRGYNGVTTNPHGAGGSIWLTAQSLAGAGKLDARPGKSGGGGYGSGGRIAVHLTGAGEDFSNFAGKMDASMEGTTMGTPGTIYLQTAADDGKGELIIRGVKSKDSHIYTTHREGGTPIVMPEDGDDTGLKRVSLIDHVQARIDAGLHVRVGEFYSEGTADYQWIQLRGGTLEMPGDWTPSNCWLRVFESNSVIRLGANGDGTLFMTNGASAYWDRDFLLEGNLRVQNGGMVMHTLNDTSDKGYRLNPHVTGWLTVDAGGSITTQDKGFSKAYGPGAPTLVGHTARGGTHGGRAWDNGGIACYGSVRCPTELGSGSANYASGGAMKLTVDGVVTNNGTITSQGSGGTTGSSGGSVWIVATNIVGTGVISAKGGNGSDGKWSSQNVGGGGGRISLKLTDPAATFGDFGGTVTAAGGYNKEYTGASPKTRVPCSSAGAGTVYRETAAEAAGQGSLEIAQDTEDYCAILPTEITPEMTETDVGDVMVSNRAWLCVRKGATLTVRGDFTNLQQPDLDLGDISDGTLEAGSVVFADAARVSRVTGTNRFARLAVTAPGKTVRFGSADDTLTAVIPGGVFAARGEEGSMVNLRGAEDGTPWLLNVDASASTDVSYADVKDSDARPGMRIVADDTNKDSGDNQNWGFMAIEPGETIRWTGTKSTAWGDPDNWIDAKERARAPVETDVVIIDAADNQPVVSAPTVCYRLSVADGATLNLAGFDLTVVNDFSCAGSLVAGGSPVIRLKGHASFAGGSFVSDSETVLLAGESYQTVDFAGQNFHVVTVLNDVDFTSGFSADFFTCETTETRTLRFAAGSTVTTKTLTLQGAAGETPMLALGSLTPGSSWSISYSAKVSVRGVAVSDSVAVGREIAAEIPSRDDSRNTNWRFGVSSAVWTGAKNAKWDEAENWADKAVPDATARVVFDKAASVTLPAEPVTVRAIEVSGATVKLTGLADGQGVTALEYFEVLDGGIACLDTRLTVNGDAYIRAGGSVTHTANSTKSDSTDHGYGVYLTVANDMLIEEGGKINAYGCGFYIGSGPGTEGDYACYGGRGTATSKVPYGSMFNPAELGSGGSGSAGGGRVILSVGGTLTVNGEIDADGKKIDNRSGSGGCVNITCGTLAGASSGFVHARGGDYTQNVSPGCGGRVALCQTAANDLAAWNGRLAAWGGLFYTPTGLPTRMPGSVYLQMADEEEYAGTLVVDNNGGSTGAGGVDLPVTNQCPDAVKCYRTTTVRLQAKGTLYVTEDVTVKELELEANTRVNLNGHTLTIKSHAHKKGKGWPSNWKTAIVYPGADADGNPGKIVWEPWGLKILVR